MQDTKPIWFYCSRDTHCNSGMVGVINAEAGGDTLQDYAKAAAKAKDIRTPGNKWQPGAFQGTLSKSTMGGMGGGMGGMGGMNSSSSSPPGNAAGHVAASTSMVGAMAGFIAWALL